MICGIDIGGTKMECAIYDRSLNRGKSWRVATPGQNYKAFLQAVADLVEHADVSAGGLQAVGLAVPGVVDRDGWSISIHVPCINGKRVVDDIEMMIKRPIAHDNDIRTFTLSEAQGGAIDGARVAMGLILGTGVGGSLCIEGRLLRSTNGIAGEYGHLPMPRNLLEKYRLQARRCPCGASGCVEQTLSGPGLLQLSDRIGPGYESIERLLADLRAGAPAAERIFSAYVDCLGYFLSRLTLTLDPDVVVFGGGLSAIEEIYAKLPSSISAYLFDGVRPPAVVPPAFGAAGGVRGAAILALELAADASRSERD